MIAAAFLCAMTAPGYVTDGDTIRCANGTRVRIAGVQAPDKERSAPCRRRDAAYVCSNTQAARSRAIVQRLVMGRTLACQPVGKSYARIVARCTLPDGRSLSCAAIAAGAATRWDSYWRRYGMGECR
jgi:endonuclease YncB( thermonuclease family)